MPGHADTRAGEIGSQIDTALVDFAASLRAASVVLSSLLAYIAPRHVTPVIAQTLSSNEAQTSSNRRQADHSMHGLTLSDAQLITLARAGERGVEEHLYSRLAPLVNRLVWGLLGADGEHNDVIHEIFIRIFRNVRTLRKPESLETWAARLAINTVRNELRKRRLRRWVFWNEFEGASSLRYVADLDGRELLTRAYAALGKLPPDEHVILSLRLFEAKTLEELAPLLGCSLGTIKRRLRKAKTRFVRLARQDTLLAEWMDRSPASQVGEDDE
jgi:RNA polymerase sigma-70 factor, ECF subfamily